MEGPQERPGFEKTSFTGEDELYISYYQRSEIEQLLEEHGFQIKEFTAKITTRQMVL
jgi:hypothetical protein